MIMFDDVAKAAQIDTIEKKTKTGRRGSRAGRNARRRLRDKQGRFLAEQSREGVKDVNPSPENGHRHEDKGTAVADEAADFGEDRHRVCVVKTTRQKKKKKWKERGEWPATGVKTEQTSLKLVAELELAAKKAETRAVAAEAKAAELKRQLEAELEKTVELLDVQEKKIGVEASERKRREIKTRERKTV